MKLQNSRKAQNHRDQGDPGEHAERLEEERYGLLLFSVQKQLYRLRQKQISHDARRQSKERQHRDRHDVVVRAAREFRPQRHHGHDEGNVEGRGYGVDEWIFGHMGMTRE